MGDKNSNNILGCDDLKWCEVSVLTAVSNFKILMQRIFQALFNFDSKQRSTSSRRRKITI